MKGNKFIILYVKLILMCSLVSISENNSPIEIKNLESNNDDKRTLQQSDNYIIIQYNEEVTYNDGFLLKEFREYIDYVKLGDEIISNITKPFTVANNIPLEVHFKKPITDFGYFFRQRSTSKLKF